ncbi:MAG: hypothetical protein ACOYN3_05725 [Acidimicrobiia bacterium]
MRLDAPTFLIQWAAGGMFFVWITTRRQLVGPGYGWLMRGIYAALAILALALRGYAPPSLGRDIATGALVAVALLGIVVSVVRRRAPLAGADAVAHQRAARVQQMLPEGTGSTTTTASDIATDASTVRPFPAWLDLLAALCGVVAIAFAASTVGGGYALALFRLVAGAALVGSVTDAMSIGHWYLVQPGLPRDPIKEQVIGVGIALVLDTVALLIPVGMISVLNGSISDGWGGLLGWIWATCVVTTGALVAVTWFALRERYYSAVMAATGLLYLAILTAFGVDLVARAVLS